MWYHVTPDDHGDEVVFEPRVPPSAVKGHEDVTIPRICFSPTLEQCLMAAQGVAEWDWALTEVGRKSTKVRGKRVYVPCPVYVYAIHGRCKVVKPTKKMVPDVRITDEVWRTVSTKLKRVGEIDLASLEAGELLVNWY